MFRFLVVGLLLTAGAVAQRNVSGGTPIPEQSCYDVSHYRLVLAVEPKAKSIAGSLTMTARALNATKRIALDLDEAFKVTKVLVGDREAEFEHKDLRVWIDLPETVEEGADLRAEIAYAGAPLVAKNPPWTGGFTWSTTRDGAPWIATSCQGEGADLWWPCKDQPDDEPDTMDLIVTVPRELVVAANGTLREDRADGALRTFHWHVANPINPYCVALNIAPYIILKDTYTCIDGTATPAWFFALPESEAKAKAALPHFLRHLRHLEEVCGPYPFRNEKYGVVETPHLGMEHQSIIAYGNHYRLEDDGYDWLHHHELSHEWWGNLVTNRNWKDMWIHEGIGTYMQALYLEKTRGFDAYQAKMRSDRANLQNRGPVAPKEPRDSHQIYFTLTGNDIYYKGSWICHSLRWVLGDEMFFRVVRRWAYPTAEWESRTDGTQCRFVDTDELLAIAEHESGIELDWFFDVYLHQPRLPDLAVEEGDGYMRLRWKTPNELPFPMPVAVRIGDELRRIEMKDGSAEVKTEGKPVVVDPDDRILRATQSAGRQRRRRG